MADVGIEAFAVTYEGCHVVNPGRLVADGVGAAGGGVGGRKAGWVEVDMREGRGVVRAVEM